MVQPTETKTISPGFNDTAVANHYENAAYTVRSFEVDPHFIEMLNQSGLSVHDRATPLYADLISQYAADYCQTTTLEPRDSYLIQLAANSASFAYNQIFISECIAIMEGGQRLDRDTADYMNKFAKPVVSWVNQMITDYMYNYPDSKKSDIKRLLVNTSSAFLQRDNHRKADVIFDQELTGSRSEAIVRSILDESGLAYSIPDTEGDLRGADFLVTVDGRTYKLDVKSNLEEFIRAGASYDSISSSLSLCHVRTHTRTHEKNILLLCPLSKAQLGDRCAARPDEITTVTPKVVSSIRAAAKQINGRRP